MTELWTLPAFRLAAMVRSGAVSATQTTQSALDRLAAVNPAINAVVREMPDEALAAAALIDAALARGEDPGPLAGVPVTLKENVDQKGHPTTNGLRLQRDLIARHDSPVAANFRRAGAVIVGRTNTPAFSLRWFTDNSLHGATKNPHDPGLTPGGSSGGAAAAAAAGIGAVAHGTDIAGSIRYPAYACGVHGLRPSLGRVPAANFTGKDRHIGAQLMAVSGPIARNVEDLGLALAALSAPDIRDPWACAMPLTGPETPRRAALCLAPEGLVIAPEVEAALRDAAARLADAGWEVEETAVPPLREPVRHQVMLWLAEMRRAGADLVAREGDPHAIHTFAQMQALSPPTDLDGLMDALQRRLSLARDWALFLDEWPVLLCPVSAEPPFPDQLDQQGPEGFARCWEAQLLQIGLPLMGMPALTVTTGMNGRTPIGVQLAAARFREDLVLKAGRDIEARGAPIAPVDPQ